MADPIQTYITDDGMSLVAKALSGGFAVAFSGAEIGTGSLSGGDDPSGFSSLKVKYADAMLADTTYEGGGTCKFSAQYSVSGLPSPVLIKEIGIFASDPDAGRILFAYTNLGDNPDRLFPSSQASFYKIYDVIVTFSAGSGGVSVSINPSALVPADMVVESAAIGKIVKVGSDSKIAADISGSADKLGGQVPAYYAKADHGHDNATSGADGFMSKGDKSDFDTMKNRVNQGVKNNDSPTFAGLNMTGPINGATFV